MKNNFAKYINPTILICFTNWLIVFIFYAHTLHYSWKNYDDNIIFQETILPIPKSFSEIFEYLANFGLNHHFEASNPFYSNIANLRSDPCYFLIILFVYLLFQKHFFLYHLLSVILHSINTSILFLVLKNIYSKYLKINFTVLNFVLISGLSLYWSFHPANVEAVLLTTNWPALLTYSFCLLVFYLWIRESPEKRFSLIQLLGFFIVLMFTSEYSIPLIFIIFLYLFAQNKYSDNLPTNKALLKSTKKITLLLFGIIPFITYFLISQTKNNLTVTNNLQLFSERLLWLSPQIFLHYLKLIVFPVNLSIDQTAFVKLSPALFDPYSIFCSLMMYGCLLAAIFSLLTLKKSFSYLFFILFTPFFISLLPFLHIISPIYNLASERYLYLPSLFLTLGISNIIFFLSTRATSQTNWKLISLALILTITLAYSYRAYARTLDWENSFTLLKSAINKAPNNLFKGLRQETLSASIKLFPEDQTNKSASFYSKQALISVKKAFTEYKIRIKAGEDKTPEIVKFYGLDLQNLSAKCAFLTALISYETDNDPQKAYRIFSPYFNDLSAIDTQILKFYYKILFQTNRIDEAEELLQKGINQNKVNPALYVALSDLLEYKYKDLKQTERCLLLSKKYFPYDPATLFGLQRLYRNLNNAEKFAYYSYLYGLRSHDEVALKDSAYIYIKLGNKDKAKLIINKLLKYYPVDEQTLRIKATYEQKFPGAS